jgi:hypothetical protein
VPRTLRQTHNREVFRAVNERIVEIADQFSVGAEAQAFICECSNSGCTEQIEATLAVYQQVRETPNAYLVLAGHEDPEIEVTMLGHRDYRIVIVTAAAAAD